MPAEVDMAEAVLIIVMRLCFIARLLLLNNFVTFLPIVTAKPKKVKSQAVGTLP
jgi:hypothetical protein